MIDQCWDVIWGVRSCAGSIKVRLEGLGALKELFGVASRWKERAEAYMSRRRDGKEGSGSRLALSGLQVWNVMRRGVEVVLVGEVARVWFGVACVTRAYGADGRWGW